MKKILLFICISMLLLSACTNNSDLKTTTSDITTSKVYVTADGKVELEKRTILSDKVDILIPKDFNEMSEEMAKIKYPQERRPTLIFTNDEGTINVAFNKTTNDASENVISEYMKTFKSTFENLYPTATWYSSGVEKINGKNIGKIELLTPGIDTEIYNLMFFAEVDGKLLLATFNATEKQMNDWKPIAHEIMNSITIK